MRVTQMPATGSRGNRRAAPPVVRAAAVEPVGGGTDIRKILARFEKDDYILAGLILVLVLEGCDDYILLAALGYLFLMGLKEQ